MGKKTYKDGIMQQILDRLNLSEECVPGKPVAELLNIVTIG